MKKACLVGLASLLVGFAVRAHQLGGTPQHAPTAAQCQADTRAWGDRYDENECMVTEAQHLNPGTPNQTPINRLPMTGIAGRSYEMGTCGDVDPGNRAQYVEVGMFYAGVQNNRELSFLMRHNLLERFLAEDAEGLR